MSDERGRQSTSASNTPRIFGPQSRVVVRKHQTGAVDGDRSESAMASGSAAPEDVHGHWAAEEGVETAPARTASGESAQLASTAAADDRPGDDGQPAASHAAGEEAESAADTDTDTDAEGVDSRAHALQTDDDILRALPTDVGGSVHAPSVTGEAMTQSWTSDGEDGVDALASPIERALAYLAQLEEAAAAATATAAHHVVGDGSGSSTAGDDRTDGSMSQPSPSELSPAQRLRRLHYLQDVFRRLINGEGPALFTPPILTGVRFTAASGPPTPHTAPPTVSAGMDSPMAGGTLAQPSTTSDPTPESASQPVVLLEAPHGGHARNGIGAHLRARSVGQGHPTQTLEDTPPTRTRQASTGHAHPIPPHATHSTGRMAAWAAAEAAGSDADRRRSHDSAAQLGVAPGIDPASIAVSHSMRITRAKHDPSAPSSPSNSLSRSRSGMSLASSRAGSWRATSGPLVSRAGYANGNASHMSRSGVRRLMGDRSTREWLTSQYSGRPHESGASPAATNLAAASAQRMATGSQSPMRRGGAGRAFLPAGVVLRSKEEEAKVYALMQDTADWNFDLFALHEICGQATLFMVTHQALKTLGLRDSFQLERSTMEALLIHIAAHYSDSAIGERNSNPYHTDLHAADVTQSLYSMLTAHSALRTNLGQVEAFAMVIGAVIHDFRHKGVNNKFLEVTGHEVSIIYNDKSALENMSLAEAFHLLNRKEYDICAALTTAQRREFRQCMIHAVLATDLARHFDYVGRLRAKGGGAVNWGDDGDRELVRALVLKCADIGHPAKPWHLHERWSNLITAEFFRQGDRERELGLPVSPLCDRHTVRLPKSQLGFMGFLVRPMFDLFCNVLRDRSYLETIASNEERWQQLDTEMEEGADVDAADDAGKPKADSPTATQSEAPPAEQTTPVAPEKTAFAPQEHDSHENK